MSYVKNSEMFQRMMDERDVSDQDYREYAAMRNGELKERGFVMAAANETPFSAPINHDKLIEDWRNGIANPLFTFIELKRMTQEIEAYLNEVKPSAITEAGKYRSGEVVYGMAVSVMQNAGAKWDYKNVPEWVEKKKELEKIEERAKAAYTAKVNGEMLVKEGAELIHPATYKPGSTTVKVELPKK